MWPLHPPTLPHSNPAPCPSQIHFKTFVLAFKAIVTFDTDLSADFRATVTRSLETAENVRSEYMVRNHDTLQTHETQVRSRRFHDKNADLENFTKHLGDEVLQLRLQHSSMPPPDNLAIPIRPPTFARLRQLVTEGSPASLVGRMNPGLALYIPQPTLHPTRGQHLPQIKKYPPSTRHHCHSQSRNASHNFIPKPTTTAISHAALSYQNPPGLTEPNTNFTQKLSLKSP